MKYGEKNTATTLFLSIKQKRIFISIRFRPIDFFAPFHVLPPNLELDDRVEHFAVAGIINVFTVQNYDDCN